MKKLVQYLANHGWTLWAAGMCSAAGWHVWTWQFWAAMLPLGFLVNLRDTSK